MRIVSFAIIVVLLAIASFGCRKEGTWGVRGTGENETEVRPAMGFDGIKLKTDAEVIYIKDSIYKVEVDAQDNIRSILITEVQGGDLVIDLKRRVVRANKVTVTVRTPHMRRLVINGSGNINSKSIIEENDLLLNISGSGNMSVPTVSVQTLYTKISGSGCIFSDGGNVQNAYHSISGSGHIRTEYLTSVNSETKVSGSGSIILKVLNELNVAISGSGNVRYHGQPSVNADISGSGRVIALD